MDLGFTLLSLIYRHKLLRIKRERQMLCLVAQKIEKTNRDLRPKRGNLTYELSTSTWNCHAAADINLHYTTAIL
jgi:hypothetical protein